MDLLAAVLLLTVGLGWLGLFLTADGVRPALLLLLLSPEQIVSNWFGEGQQPIGFPDRWPIVGVAALLLLAAHELGHWLLRLVKLSDSLSRLERSALGIGAGLNVVSLYTLLVGLAGLLHSRWLIVVPVCALAATTMVRIGKRVRNRSTSPEQDLSGQQKQDDPPLDRGTKMLLGVAAAFSLAILLSAMLPPWDFDVREYHLQVPKEWWQAGRIEFLPHNVYGNMPLGAEMQALAAMAFMSGDEGWWIGALAGKLTMACYAPLTAALLFAASRRWLATGIGAWAAVLYLAQPWVLHTAMSGLNEPAVAFYGLAALYALCLLPLRKNTALLSGFFAGAAAACKYPAVLYVALPLGLLVFLLPDGESDEPRSLGERVGDALRNFIPGPRWVLAVAFALGGTLGGGPWYLKNAALAGNPVYPLAGDLFGGETRTPEKNEQWKRAHQTPQTSTGARYSFGQFRESARSVFFSDRYSSPLLLPLLLITAAVTISRRIQPADDETRDADRMFTRSALALLLFIAAVWWLATHRIDRFLVPALPFAVFFAAMSTVLMPGPMSRRVLQGFLCLGLGYSALVAVSAMASDNRWFVALSALREDETNPAGIARVSAAQRWLNEHTQAGRAVLLVGDAAPFDLKPRAYYNTCFDNCLLADWTLSRSRRERQEALTSRDIEYVYVDWNEIGRYRSPGNYGYDPRWTRELLKQLIDQGLLVPVATRSDDRREFTAIPPSTPLPKTPRPTIYRVSQTAN